MSNICVCMPLITCVYMCVCVVDEEVAKNQPIDTTRMFVFDWNLR